MPIDKMDWHYNGDFPEDLPNENGGTHTGMYLTWIITRDLIGKMHLENSPGPVELVKKREMSGRDFLIRYCDEKLVDEDLNEEGLAFTKHYYGDEEMKEYILDYLKVLASDLESVYHVENTWDNYNKISTVIDQRYREWKASN